jgi:hypothetical protein
VKLETANLDDLGIVILVVLFFGLGFAFGLNPTIEESQCQPASR